MISGIRQRRQYIDTDPSISPTKDVVILRLELLPLLDDNDWWVYYSHHGAKKTPPPTPAYMILRHLVSEIARQRRQTLELHITPPISSFHYPHYPYCQKSSTTEKTTNSSSQRLPSHPNGRRSSSLYDSNILKLIPFLQHARQLGVLSRVVVADPSLLLGHWHSMGEESNGRRIQHRTHSFLFEILANPTLTTLSINVPSSSRTTKTTSTTRTTTTTILQWLGHAIAKNPAIHTLIVYSYRDDDGSATTALLEPLSMTTKTPQRQHLTTLHLYCPLQPISTYQIVATVSHLLQHPLCSLQELEITCCLPAAPPSSDEHTHIAGTPWEAAAETTVTPSDKVVFPLAHLVYHGILANQSRSLTSLGLFHCELTTSRIDQELLHPLLVSEAPPSPQATHRSPPPPHAIAYIRLDGNHIDSLYFPLFMKGSPTTTPKTTPTTSIGHGWWTLKRVDMDHNPWQQQLQQAQRPHLPLPPLPHHRRSSPHDHDHHHPCNRVEDLALYGQQQQEHHHYSFSPSSTVTTTHDAQQERHHEREQQPQQWHDPPWGLPCMLLTLFQRHPQMVFFGVDPSSYCSSPSLLLSLSWEVPQKEHQQPSPSYDHVGRQHHRYEQLIFTTLLNRAGLRPQQKQPPQQPPQQHCDFLIGFPVGLWPRILYRAMGCIGDQRQGTKTTIKRMTTAATMTKKKQKRKCQWVSNSSLLFQCRNRITQNSVVTTCHCPLHCHHHYSYPQKNSPHQRRGLLENHQASLMFHLILQYHPWIIINQGSMTQCKK